MEAKNWEKAVTDKELEIEIDEYIDKNSKEALERIRSFYPEDLPSTVEISRIVIVFDFYSRNTVKFLVVIYMKARHHTMGLVSARLV